MLKSKALTGGIKKDFIPKSFDNDKDQDPVKITYSLPTAGDRRELLESFVASESKKIHFFHGIIKRLVVSIENYVDANGKQIKDGIDLVNRGDDEIVDEMAAELINQTFGGGKEAEKKSQEPQG